MKTLFSLFALLTIASISFAQSTPEKVYPTDYQTTTLELTDNSFESVRAFVSNTLAAPVPASFSTPSYIQQASTLQEASNEVGARYPEFFGREGDELLTAIAEYPSRFLSLISETKAIRAQFYPATE